MSAETRTRVEPQVDGTYHAVQDGPHPGRVEIQRKKGFKTEADAQAFLDSMKPKPELAVEQPANPVPTAEEIAAAEEASKVNAEPEGAAGTEAPATAEVPATETPAEQPADAAPAAEAPAEGSATAVEAAASTRRKRS